MGNSSNPKLAVGGLVLESGAVYDKNSDFSRYFFSSVADDVKAKITGFYASITLNANELVWTYISTTDSGFKDSRGSEWGQANASRFVYYSTYRHETNGVISVEEVINNATITMEGNRYENLSKYKLLEQYSENTMERQRQGISSHTFYDVRTTHSNTTESYFTGSNASLGYFRELGGGNLFGAGWWNSLLGPTQPDSASSETTPVNNVTSSSTNSLTLNKNYDVSAITNAILGSSTPSNALSVEVSDKTLTINASSWTGAIKVNFAAKAAAQGERLDAKQIDFSSATPAGSVLQGGDGNDQLWGKAGWDVFDGGKGNDLIRAGNGRDILTGGLGADELHGDFGWNTYKSEKDGFSDLIAIKSDQHLSNWLYGKAGNNPNGEKADIIEGLDANDKIRIIGVFSPDITVRAGATAHGVSGIGIYAKGALEALYTGGDLSVAQLTAMTSGDGSAAAMANQVSSYGWTGV